MASKRILKRNLNNMVFDIVDECFFIQAMDEKKFDLTESIIDEAAIFQDQILVRINAAKSKNEFRPITLEIEESAINFIKKLNGAN